MKRIVLLHMIICTIWVLNHNSVDAQIYLDLEDQGDLTFEQIVTQTEAYFDVYGRDKGKGYKPFERWKYEKERSLDKNGYIISNKEQAESFQRFVKANPNTGSRNLNINFTEMGPTAATNTATWSSALARLSAIGLDPNDVNHMIVGSPTGGIWKTTDYGSTWEGLYDFATNIDIMSLHISHANSDHYYAGTSDRIVRSMDGGKTWDGVSGGPTGGEVNTIIMDPSDANVLLASKRFGGGGIWRSTDGGDTWTNVYNPGVSCYDIEFKPGNSNTVYASGSGFVAKSTNNGATWTDVTAGTMGGGVVMLAVTPADANYVYALQETGGGYNGTWRSTNSGTSWSLQSDNSSGSNNILTYDQTSGGGQAPRDMDIVVSPTNRNEVYVAGTELWKSTNSAVAFTQIADWLVSSGLPFIHADVDLMYYVGNRLYCGTDGGLFISTNAGTSFTDYTPGIGARQFYRIGASATEADRVSGGSQDNGTGVVVGGTWRDFMGADGMETFIDWSDEDIIYGNVQYGSLYKSTDGGLTTVSITNSPGSGAWVTPTEQDPANSNTLYHGKNELYKSTNGAGSWTALTSMNITSKIDEIEIAPSNNQVICFSHEDVLYRTTNGGTTWTNISPNANYINYIDIHPTNSSRILIAQSGAVFESTNGGSTWTDITANLPNITYYCGIYHGGANDAIYLAGRYGIWHKDNSTSGNWRNVNGNLPIVQVRELEIRSNTMYVATYGRGLWKGTVNNSASEGMSCTDAIDITMPGTYTAPGPSYGNGCNNCSSADHANWFKFIPPLDGAVSIGSCFAGVDTRFWLYSGSCGSLTSIGGSDDDCRLSEDPASNGFASYVDSVAVTAGTPIFIEWDDRWSDNSFFFTIEYKNVNCPTNFTGANALTGVQNTSAKYETDGVISSTQTISGAGTIVEYDSGNSINLNPNFEVVLGAEFRAFIDGCGGLLRPTDDD